LRSRSTFSTRPAPSSFSAACMGRTDFQPSLRTIFTAQRQAGVWPIIAGCGLLS
jgi:hypothetical protein